MLLPVAASPHKATTAITAQDDPRIPLLSGAPRETLTYLQKRLRKQIHLSLVLNSSLFILFIDAYW